MQLKLRVVQFELARGLLDVPRPKPLPFGQLRHYFAMGLMVPLGQARAGRLWASYWMRPPEPLTRVPCWVATVVAPSAELQRGREWEFHPTPSRTAPPVPGEQQLRAEAADSFED